MRLLGLFILFIGVQLVGLAQSKTDAKRNGILSYQIIPKDSVNNRVTSKEDFLEIDYRMSLGSNDSILTQTFSNEPVNVPVMHSSFAPLFLNIKAGDWLTVVINADSFYKHTMRQTLPPYIKNGDSLIFYFKIHDVLSNEELGTRLFNKNQEAIKEDSLELIEYVSALNRVKRTPEGIYYLMSANGDGKLIRYGDKVTVKYRAYLFDGEVFSKSGPNGYTFMLGTPEVLKGWNIAFKLMSKGSKFKLVVPQDLAYGSEGNDIVEPFKSIVFDIEIINVE